jgi:sugar transferase (PEP-CTERM/EpsH1 system associated)
VRILFLTHRLPYAANRGDRIRALHLLRFLAQRCTVDLVSLVDDEHEESHVHELQHLAASVSVARTARWHGYMRALATLPTPGTLTHALLDAPDLEGVIQRAVDSCRPDVVLAFCSGMARFAMQPPLDSIPFVLDMVDVDSLKWKDLGTTAPLPARWIYATEAKRLARFEATASRRAHAVLVVNSRERSSLLEIAPGANVHVVPNGIALDDFAPGGPPAVEPRVTFCGIMNYAPNEEAALWMARDVWPLVQAKRPDARLSLVGASPTPAVRRLASLDPTVEVTGTVPDVRPYLWRSAVGVAPLRLARGIQNKVLEAVAAGLPCVVTPAVSEGLPAEVLPATVLASSIESCATAVLDLLSLSPNQRREIAGHAHLQALAWGDRLAPLLPLLESARSHATKRSTPSANVVDGR